MQLYTEHLCGVVERMSDLVMCARRIEQRERLQ
jgi:hypothetical protein